MRKVNFWGFFPFFLKRDAFSKNQICAIRVPCKCFLSRFRSQQTVWYPWQNLETCVFLKHFFWVKMQSFDDSITAARAALTLRMLAYAKHFWLTLLTNPYPFSILAIWFSTLVNIDPGMNPPVKSVFLHFFQASYSQRIVNINLQVLAYVQHYQLGWFIAFNLLLVTASWFSTLTKIQKRGLYRENVKIFKLMGLSRWKIGMNPLKLVQNHCIRFGQTLLVFSVPWKERLWPSEMFWQIGLRFFEN